MTSNNGSATQTDTQAYFNCFVWLALRDKGIHLDSSRIEMHLQNEKQEKNSKKDIQTNHRAHGIWCPRLKWK